MSRMLWFGLGALVGGIASRTIDMRRIDMSAVNELGIMAQLRELLGEYRQQADDYKNRLATNVENRMSNIGDKIGERGQNVAEQIRGITLVEDTEEQHTSPQPAHAHTSASPARASEQKTTDQTKPQMQPNKPQPSSRPNDQIF